MTTSELQAMRLAHQYLTRPSDKMTVACNLCGMQAQFLTNAYHALRIRCKDVLSPDTWGKSLVKSWTLRGTMHVFAEDDLPLFLYGYPHALRPQDTFEGDVCISTERKQYFAGEILRLIEGGICEREALKRACLDLGMTPEESESIFDPWGGTIRALAESGAICYRVQERKTFMLCKPFRPMDADSAEEELVRRYFTHYGPATLCDASYFLGMTQTKIRKRLQTLPIREIESDGQKFFYISQGETNFPDIPDCVLLAGFDPLMLGYAKQKSLFLPAAYMRGIFNLSGIVFPAVLLHGRVVGKWKREKVKLTFTLFESLDAPDRRIVQNTADRLFENIKKFMWQDI